jgi:acyl-CoA synthetase (AMP-forming)/AMP-acid ligase II
LHRLSGPVCGAARASAGPAAQSVFLRICLTGADVCPIDLQERIAAILGAPLYNIWGATEVIGSLTFGLQRGPVMRIVKDAQIRLIDDKGAEVAHGEVGELLIRGANVFAGYWNDPEATEESLRAGWYHTGDLMRRGEGDDLWFVSRKKDIIIRGGTNISPMEVEQALRASHPAVEEAAVVGIPDAALGQRVVGFVKLADGTEDTVLSGILDTVATRLASYKVPEYLIILEALPRNALSKVDRTMLLTIALGSEKAAGRPRQRAVRAKPKQPARRCRVVIAAVNDARTRRDQMLQSTTPVAASNRVRPSTVPISTSAATGIPVMQ